MDTCPCCADILLRHIGHGRLYWFCRSCWAEMPNMKEYRDRAAIVEPRLASMPQSNPVITPQRSEIPD